MNVKKNREVFSEVIVGVFMVAVLALLVYFTILISGVELFGGKNRGEVTVLFSNVGGLKPRDSVILRGMTVGSVEKMHLENSEVNVTLLVQRDVIFHEGYRISVNSGSLLGGNYLLIEEGTGTELPLGTVLRGERPTNWMRDLGEIVANLREATEGDYIKNIVTNLDAAVASFKVAVGRVESGQGTLGKLFSDDLSLYNDLSNVVANLKSVTGKIDSGDSSLGRLINDDGNVYTNLSATVANLKSISDRVEKGEGTLGKLLSDDPTVYNDLQETVANLKSLTARLESGEGSLGKLLNDSKIYNDLDATVANLREVTDRLVKGEGTLGKLSKEEELYTEVQGLIKDVRQTVDNFRDTTPISAFASLIMGGL
ncbi:MAG: MlaD family protein [Verrucomicrobiota bacterium]|jgi:phospholipid/cholesterol/gamma-HCH transport system substrate-binding protein|nr:MlaD family protein [Verrucomicrobiota bacterium]